MTAPGGPPRRGRHFLDDALGGGASSFRTGPSASAGHSVPPGSGRRTAHADATGPMGEPAWRSLDHTLSSRQGGGDEHGSGRQHPSAPLPPLPTGAWDRLRPRPEPGGDDATVAAPRLAGRPDERSSAGRPQGDLPEEDLPEDDAAAAGGPLWEEQTGGLDVIGANVDEDRPPRRRFRRGRRADSPPSPAADGEPAPEPRVEDLPAGRDGDVLDASGGDGHEPFPDDDIPVEPYDGRSDGRRRRRPFAVILALLVLGGIVTGIVLGGQQLFGLLAPSSPDYAGAGTGSIDVRVDEGDTLSDIARTLAEADVIASTGPFVSAADAHPDATSIQPGVYTLRQQMSGEAALELLLDPASRQVARVTVPEGFTVEQILARLAEETGTPLEELQAARDPAALNLPAYSGGQLEGFLFPATYDFEPGTAPQQMLQRMVDTFTTVAGRLRLEERAAALGRTPAEVVTVASMVQSETRLDEERADVAQVIYNRLEQGIPLGIDATLAYGLDKSGNDLTVSDLQTDGPYNTRTRQGLPPTPISSPGEASLEAALAPSSGDLLYYVLESQDGSHFFTSDYAEFQQARQRCADAGLGCGG